MRVRVVIHDHPDGKLRKLGEAIKEWEYFDEVEFDGPISSISDIGKEKDADGEFTYRLVWLSEENHQTSPSTESEIGKATRTHFFCDPEWRGRPKYAVDLPDFTVEGEMEIDHDKLKWYIYRHMLKADLLSLHLRRLRERLVERWDVVAEIDNSPHAPSLTEGERTTLCKKFAELKMGFDDLISRDEKRLSPTKETKPLFRELLRTLSNITIWKRKLMGDSGGKAPAGAEDFVVSQLPDEFSKIEISGNGTLIDFALLRILGTLYDELRKADSPELVGRWKEPEPIEAETGAKTNTEVGAEEAKVMKFVFDEAISCYDNMFAEDQLWDKLDVKNGSLEKSFRFVLRRKRAEAANLIFGLKPDEKSKEYAAFFGFQVEGV